jgi:hypothetical protein
MESSNFKIDGLTETVEALKGLPEKLKKQFIRTFLRKAAKKFIVDPLKSKLHYSENLEKTIKVVPASDDREAIQAGVTGRGYKLRWLDLGTKIRKSKRGKSKGQIIGKNQIQPAIEEGIPEIMKYTEDEFANEINKMLERRLKRLKKSL